MTKYLFRLTVYYSDGTVRNFNHANLQGAMIAYNNPPKNFRKLELLVILRASDDA